MGGHQVSTTPHRDAGWDGRFEQIVREAASLLAAEEPLTPDADLASLGMDSLNMLSLMIAVEAEYSISIPTDLLVSQTFATPGSLWATVQRLRTG